MAFCVRQLHILSQQSFSRLPFKIATKTNMTPGFLKLRNLVVHAHQCFTITQTHCAKHCTYISMKESSVMHKERIQQNNGLCHSKNENLSKFHKILHSTSNTHRQFLGQNPVFSDLHRKSCTHLHPAQRTYPIAASSSSSNKSDRTSQSQPDLDLEMRLSPQHLEGLRNNLSARGSGFNLDQLLEDYKQWRELNAVRTSLETERRDIAKRMAVLVKGKMSEQSLAEKEALTRRGKAIKEELKDIMPSWLRADHKVTAQALQLPTDLHPLTPPTEDQAVEMWKGTVEDPGHASHFQLAEQRGLLKFSTVGPRAVYLLGETAELEQALLHSAATCLADRGYTPLAAPEMFRSLVVEGCGMTSQEVLNLEAKEEEKEANEYYLKGTSLLSYAAFLTRVTVRQECLPLTMYSLGRHYRPDTGANLPGLYGPVQSSRVTMFGATQFGEQATEIHDHMVRVTWDLVQRLGLPAREMMVCATRLSPSESRRTDVQIWAPGLQQYVTMASVSIHNDYASRRLMSKASNGNLLHMVSGVAMDVSVVLASILEHSGGQGGSRLLPLPDMLKDSNLGGGQP